MPDHLADDRAGHAQLFTKRALDQPLTRFEQAGDEFHRAVRDGFLAQALAEPERWVVIDGTGTVDEVAAAVWAAVEPVLKDPERIYK